MTQVGYYEENLAEHGINSSNLEEAVHNFMNAIAIDRSAFETLTQTNKMLEEQVANLI